MAYWTVLHGLYGQTLGKWLCGVVVLDISERKLSMKQAVLRVSPGIVFLFLHLAVTLYLIQTGAETVDPNQKTISEVALRQASTIFLIADVGTMLINPKRRAIHDYIAGSTVVCCDKRTL